MPREERYSDIGEISNACLRTLGYHTYQVLKFNMLWFAHYNGGHKCPAGYSSVQKWTMHYNA